MYNNVNVKHNSKIDKRDELYNNCLNNRESLPNTPNTFINLIHMYPQKWLHDLYVYLFTHCTCVSFIRPTPLHIHLTLCMSPLGHIIVLSFEKLFIVLQLMDLHVMKSGNSISSNSYYIVPLMTIHPSKFNSFWS